MELKLRSKYINDVFYKIEATFSETELDYIIFACEQGINYCGNEDSKETLSRLRSFLVNKINEKMD